MMPSPHTDEHVVKPHSDVTQVQPGSIVQPLLQPSPSLVSLSSHSSSCAWMPSPQVELHELGSALQLKPHSTMHVDEHPSLDSEAPSSHCSLTDTSPLPHSSLHEDCPQAAALHSHPCSIVQPLLQPSPLSVSLSSHASSCARMPSPQVELHELGAELLQLKPHSTVHVVEQPSSLIVFASSHCSSV
jgi:hypothetical protein